MTRETKIGLLVGLAFIIVIGILLSDHLTSSTEPPQAAIAVVGNSVRSGVSTPGATSNPPITSTVTPAPLSPRTTVPTQSDLTPRPQPVQPVQVAVGGPSAPQSSAAQVQVRPPVEPVTQAPARTEEPLEPRNTTAVTDGGPIVSAAPPVAPQNPQNEVQPEQPQSGSNDIAQALRDAAHQHGEELVNVGGSGATPASSKQAPAGTKPYVAAEGDSLSKMAAKFFGTNNKANREAICNANPSLKQNPNVVIVGKTYYIPTSGTSTATASNTTTPAPAPVAQTPAAPVTNSTESWYTVKEGDSLWKIATEQCGSPAAIQAIRDLNKDTLKGDNVIVNTKLRLPNKVASAN